MTTKEPTMGAKSLIPPAVSLYDQDFVVWTAETARLLRAGRLNQLDIAHLAEEIEDMGTSYHRELDSRLTVLVHHLLKWRYQAAKRSRSWKSTIITQRAELSRLFEQAPSLRRTAPPSVGKVYATAARLAGVETGLPEDLFPRRCPFSTDEILDDQFFPEP